LATQKQLIANRKNAQSSTGPKTEKGKAVVAQNAITHGLRTTKLIITSESEEQFDLHKSQLIAELNPNGPTERILARRIVILSWRLERAERFRNAAFDALEKKAAPTKMDKLLRSVQGLPGFAPEPDLGDIIVNDFKNTRVLERLLMYERRIENSLRKMLLDFQRQKLLRQYQSMTTPEETLS
jgi:hypothetical protein